MSLINRVLKDLEKRHANDLTRDTPLPAAVRAAPGGRGKLPLRIALVALLLALVGAWFWWSTKQPKSPPPTVAPIPAPPAMTSAAPSTAPSDQAARIGGSGNNGPQASPASPPASNATAAGAHDVAPSAKSAGSAGAGARDEAGSKPGKKASSAEALARKSKEGEAMAMADDRTNAAARADVAARVANAKPKSPRATEDRPQPSTGARPGPDLANAPEASDRAQQRGFIDKQVRAPTAAEQGDAEFRRGMQAFQAGRADEAEAAWTQALTIDPSNASARQALLGLVLDRGERGRAEQILKEGLQINPRQAKQAMLLARLQLDRGSQSEALRTLEDGLPYAQWSAEYLAMTATVLSRTGRHTDAAELYRSALRVGPANPVWEIGLGLALRADGKPAEAKAAFERARESKALTPDLQTFVDRQLREMK
ncbi:MAG TPA: tetratricopeptide repeat protein [Burkholderiales bacterium]|nr:tetratricopeptide repeat protein [Burkholderiales bacterium]